MQEEDATKLQFGGQFLPAYTQLLNSIDLWVDCQADHRMNQIKNTEFADGEALTITEVQTLLIAARQAPGVPPAPDNKWVAVDQFIDDRVRRDFFC